MSFHATVIAAALLVSGIAAKVASGSSAPFPEEFYGYIPQNPQYDSNFFYAIRGNANATFRATAPLVLFLQGGPGATSLFSDFLETGPEKLTFADNAQGYALTPREHAWTNHATMLYVDNPIGTGFSYTVDPRGYSTTDESIADNLVDFLQKFLIIHSEYQSTPLWVFCESYGGKMTAYFGAAIVRAIQQKTLTANFKGVALGDGWVDPVDCMYSYAPYLTSFSQVNPAQAANITAMAALAESALEEGNGTLATQWWGNQQDYISAVTDNLNWYNSLYYYDYTADNLLDVFLATNFTRQLGSLIPANVSYNSQGGNVFGYMGGAFMRDGISQVLEILNAGYQVNIYTGQVDLIVDVDCMNAWVKKMNWPHLDAFYNSYRAPLQLSGDLNIGGFVQSYNNLTIWNINKAGHMVPLDNPPYAELMMATIVGSEGVQNIRFSEGDKEAVREGPLHKRSKPTRKGF